MKQLIVNADDLGLHPGINAGVFRAHREGIVTSTSISANGAAFEEACRGLAADPQLGVGVHLTLVGEAPLSPPGHLPTLAPDGRFPSSFASLFARLWMGRVREAEIEAELAAQVARVHEAGLRIGHLDGHQHVHLHPAVLPVVVRLARRFGIPGLRAAARVRPLSGLRPLLLSTFSHRGSVRARAEGLRTPDVLLGTADSGRLETASLRALVGALTDGVSELVCHPGEADGAIARAYPWGFRWDQETAALTSPEVRAALEERQVRLISYRDL